MPDRSKRVLHTTSSNVFGTCRAFSSTGSHQISQQRQMQDVPCSCSTIHGNAQRLSLGHCSLSMLYQQDDTAPDVCMGCT